MSLALLHETIDSLDASTVRAYLATLPANAVAALGHPVGYLLDVFFRRIRSPGADVFSCMQQTIAVADVLIAHKLGSVDEEDVVRMMDHPDLAIAVLQKSTQYDLATCIDGMRRYFYHNTDGKTRPYVRRMLGKYRAVFTAVIKTWKKQNKPNNYFEDNDVLVELTEPPPIGTEEPNVSMYEIEKEVVEDCVRSRARLFAARRPLLELNEGLELYRRSETGPRANRSMRHDDINVNFLRDNVKEIASYVDQEKTKKAAKKGGTRRRRSRNKN